MSSASRWSELVGRLVALTLVVSLTGCYQDIDISDPDGSAPPWDAAAYDAGPTLFVEPLGQCVEPTGVDLLLVVDGSASMIDEQVSLAEALPSLIRALIDPPDDDGDGSPDWIAITDLQVGIATIDMGTGGFAVPTCTRSDFGDDGVLRTTGNTEIPGCSSTYPPFLTFTPGSATPEAFAAEVACVARVGSGGCGFEQPLEAALKALSPAAPTAYTGPGYVPPTFFRGTFGHGDGVNGGFVRPDTLLGVVILTDEEDCSARDPDIFNPSSATYTADLNLRCFEHGDRALHPVSRYVEGLQALRAGRPDLLAYALIAGIPPDLTASDATFDEILDDARMQEMVDPTTGNRMVPSCDVPGRGVAFPPRRMVEVARELTGARATVQSICQADFTPATDAIARLLGRRACANYME